MGDAEPTDFLYPMVDGTPTDIDALLADLATSARSKAQESHQTSALAIEGHDAMLDTIATAVVERVSLGGRLLTCGNGGSATDAEGLADLFQRPPMAPAVQARCLAVDVAVLTALANDLGVDAIFSRQVHAHAWPHDVLVALSTSGNSTNLLEAARAARSLGLLTVGIAGDTGGRMASSGLFDHVVVIRATSIHRIQEAQSRICLELWRRAHVRLTGTAAQVAGTEAAS